MGSFIEPLEDIELLINGTGGKPEKVKLTKSEYYVLEKGNEKIPVIKHDALIRLADAHGKKIEKTILEFGQYNAPDNFCFIHRAFGVLDNGVVVDEVGEANPANLDNNISAAYPAIMSNKRAQDRLLIRLLGLTGKAYSDVEFSFSNNDTNFAEAEQNDMTVEEAERLTVSYGRFRNGGVTLKQLMEQYPEDFDWLLNTYKVNAKSSEHMKKLKKGAIILAKASTQERG